MRLTVYAAGFCAAVLAGMACAAPPAEAAQKKRHVAYNQSSSTVTTGRRPRARITVQRRSFLDAGTEVLPGDRKFTDYAWPPAYSPLQEALGPGKDFRRAPLLDPWDFPGASRF